MSYGDIFVGNQYEADNTFGFFTFVEATVLVL